MRKKKKKKQNALTRVPIKNWSPAQMMHKISSDVKGMSEIGISIDLDD